MKKDNMFSLIGFVVWILCAIFYLYEFLLRTVVGTFQSPIMQEFSLSSFKFSFLSTTVFMISYGLMQIPISIIVSRIGLKKSVLIGSTCCAVATLAFAYTHSYPLALLVRFFTGFGAGFGFICLLVSVYEWMPNRLSGSFIGLSQFIGVMGPMLAAGPLNSLAQSQDFQWRYVFISLGAFGLCFMIMAFLFVRNNHDRAGNFIILKYKKSSLAETFKTVLKPQIWKIALFSALIYFSIEYLTENEGKAFLMQKGFNSETASYMITFGWIGYAIGCPLLGYLSDIFSRRRIVMICSSFFYLIALVIFVFSAQKYLLFMSFIFLGIGASGQSVGFAIMAEQHKKENIAFGIGINNAMITTFIALNAPIIGYVIDVLKTGAFPTQETYTKAFLILIFVAIVTVFLSFSIKETFCKSKADFTYLSYKKIV